MSLNDIPSVSFATARSIIDVAMANNSAILLIGDPGVGKSAIVSEAAAKIGLPCVTLLGSTLDPTDVAGLPMRATENNRMLRLPLDEIYAVAEKPGVLFLDEISAAPGAVQAALLRLILERVAGSVKLHPETRVIAACNPPEQAPGGFELSAPLVGRMTILHFVPEDGEVLGYMRNLGSEEDDASAYEKALREESLQFVSVVGACPELLQIKIPTACISGGQPWASPRSIERALRGRAQAKVLGLDMHSPAVYAMTAGAIGERAATTYNGVLRLVGKLPTAEEILAAPDKVTVPKEKSEQVAVLAILPKIAKENLYCAFIYCARLMPEFQLAGHKILIPLSRYNPPITDKWAKKGLQARQKMADLAGGKTKVE